MLSMTGYGKSEYNENGVSITVEIKTVNNRMFDFNCKIPRAFMEYETEFRKIVSKFVSRGRIDFFINFSDKRVKEGDLELNLDKAEVYFNFAKKLSEKFQIENDISVTSLLKMPEVLSDNYKTDNTEFIEIIKGLVESACQNLNEMRKIEGEKLVLDMLSRMETIRDLAGKIALRAPLVAKEYKVKLKYSIEEALNDVVIDQARLLNAVAFYTDKVNIDEELTRLNSHVNQFIEIIKQPNAGKKLDFLMQEFNREANTICSKSNDIEVTGHALALKNEIEKVREQVQNLE